MISEGEIPDEWNASPPVPPILGRRGGRLVGIYRNHRSVGSAYFYDEAEANLFHAEINGGGNIE